MVTDAVPSTEPVLHPEDEGWSWHRLIEAEDLPEGRVTTVTVGRRSLAVTHYDGCFGALDNHCPHQGGSLGEGSIESGWLRCPWHGYDYSPCNGTPPPGFEDAPVAYPTEVRDDGVYVALPVETEQERTVSEVLVETMTAWGVKDVFGMVGHSNLGFAEAMRRAEDRGDLRYIGIRHEGAASFAASAYGKLTGRPAACFGIAGPGSTNLLTGLYDAKRDQAPVLAISGQVASKVKGKGAFQDLDLETVFADVAAISETVHAHSDHAELMTLVCKRAILDQTVTHLMLPDDVQIVPAPDVEPGSPEGRTAIDRTVPDESSLRQAIRRIVEAGRPVIVVGAGARFDMDPIVELAERLGAPVVTTFKAKGQISDRHPLGCGVLGRSGTPVASWFMNECDLLVVFGASFSNHTGIASYKPIVQVDRDPWAIGRHHSVDLGVIGDVGATATELVARLEAGEWVDQRPEVAARWAIWRREKKRRRADDRGRGVNSASVFEVLGEVIDPDAVVCVDVGNNTYSFGRYFEATRQTVLMSGYLGSIGFGLPAALGAWAAVGGRRQVVAVCGDGGFGQYAMEMTTAVKYGMNITCILLVNDELGKISKEQRSAEYDVWQTSLHNPNFADFARSCGALGARAQRIGELDAAIAEAVAHDGPALVEIITDPVLV
jgi:thiamine pyrophosphate-dependent acetolactate synthase large subunit-like protein/nitrite reductase/ring-hydroxylating ferredoxin subunit